MLTGFILSILTLTLVLGTLLYFRLRKNTDQTHTGEGMALQYKTFIDLVLAEDATTKLLPSKTHTIHLHSKQGQGHSSFVLTKVQGKLIVTWTWMSPNFGKRGKEWAFPIDHDQTGMFAEIKRDCDAYQVSLYEKYNLAIPVRKA